MDGFLSEPTQYKGLTFPLGTRAPEPGEAITVAPGVEWTRMPLPFSLKFINVWIIDDGDGWTIVDTGMPLPDTKDAWRKLLGERVTADKPLKRVIITHMHPDHIGAAGWLCYKYDAELWMSRLEYTTCRMLVADTGRDAPKAGIDFYVRAGWPQKAIDNYVSRFGGFGRGVSQMPDAFRRLEDGDTVRLAGQDWRVITGNGHSPEHVCLFSAALNVAITGDQLLPRISSNVSVHPTEPAANPLDDWIKSCEKLLRELPEDCFVLPAHNEPFTGAHIRLRNLIAGHDTSLTRLRQKLEKGPAKVPDTFVTLFGRAIKDDEMGSATGEALAHLNYLIHKGEVTTRPDKDGALLYSLA